MTPNSRFDPWLPGEEDAITPEESAGYQLFNQSDCVACHNGQVWSETKRAKPMFVSGAVPVEVEVRGSSVRTGSDIGEIERTQPLAQLREVAA